MGYSLRTDQYRFTEWYDIKTNTLVATELYDHTTDGNETKNVAGQRSYVAQVKKLHLQLEKLIK
jgi:iduronate 2-sulfatase